MHIVYIDEAGTHDSRYFVVAGIAVFERETYFLGRSLNQLQAKYFPSGPDPVVFHASALHAPSGRVPAPFDILSAEQRRSLAADIYAVISASRVRVFAVAMEKAGIDGDPYERGFEEILNRFDLMLARIYRDRGERQKGLVVVSESSYRENLELLARRIAEQGHRWGELHNLADIPYFAPAGSTRLLQLADFVTNAVFGRYENGYTRDLDRIAPHIDQEEGRLHGLVHIALNREGCYCPACVQRRSAPRPGPEEPVEPAPSPPQD